jgi:hypothetical protein
VWDCDSDLNRNCDTLAECDWVGSGISALSLLARISNPTSTDRIEFLNEAHLSEKKEARGLIESTKNNKV